MSSAIALIVAAYVRTGQLTPLQDLRTGREKLVSQIRNRTDFDFAVLLGQLEDDIQEIETGIRRLRPPADAQLGADS